jgi:hypothetical protein
MWIQRKIMARVHQDPRFFDLDAEWCVARASRSLEPLNKK